jgi:hypothetical protein
VIHEKATGDARRPPMAAVTTTARRCGDLIIRPLGKVEIWTYSSEVILFAGNAASPAVSTPEGENWNIFS